MDGGVTSHVDAPPRTTPVDVTAQPSDAPDATLVSCRVMLARGNRGMGNGFCRGRSGHRVAPRATVLDLAATNRRVWAAKRASLLAAVVVLTMMSVNVVAPRASAQEVLQFDGVFDLSLFEGDVVENVVTIIVPEAGGAVTGQMGYRIENVPFAFAVGFLDDVEVEYPDCTLTVALSATITSGTYTRGVAEISGVIEGTGSISDAQNCDPDNPPNEGEQSGQAPWRGTLDSTAGVLDGALDLGGESALQFTTSVVETSLPTTTTSTSEPVPTSVNQVAGEAEGEGGSEESPAEEPYFTIVGMAEDAEFRVPGGDWQPITPTTRIPADAEIFVGVDTLVLTFSGWDGTVEVDPSSQIRLSFLVGEGNHVNAQVQLLLGRVAARVNPKRTSFTSFEVKSPIATASVRGTTLAVSWDGESMAVEVEEGIVVVTTSAGEERAINGGEQVSITAAGMGETSALEGSVSESGESTNAPVGLIIGLSALALAFLGWFGVRRIAKRRDESPPSPPPPPPLPPPGD